MNSVESVVNFLCGNSVKISIAESCTAGMVASKLADVPGCGTVLEIGYVVYTEHAKHAFLGVSLQTIKSFGLTSEEVAKEMAEGALDRSGADMALAITGTAESDDELNGVVCFAYVMRINNILNVVSETIKFDGARNVVRSLAATHAISRIPRHYETFVKVEGNKIY